jgi:hypothetical protein
MSLAPRRRLRRVSLCHGCGKSIEKGIFGFCLPFNKTAFQRYPDFTKQPKFS